MSFDFGCVTYIQIIFIWLGMKIILWFWEAFR